MRPIEVPRSILPGLDQNPPQSSFPLSTLGPKMPLHYHNNSAPKMWGVSDLSVAVSVLQIRAAFGQLLHIYKFSAFFPTPQNGAGVP